MADEWTVLIADDEPAARRGVRQLLAGYAEFTVCGEARNGADALAALDARRPDLLFLDIQMPGLDGFDVIRRRTPERMPLLVFLTAYDQFALRAFEAQALDYLVKPVTEARFAATMARVTRQLRAARAIEPEPPIVVTTAKGITVLRPRDIDWIESSDNYARLWIGGRSYLLRESMRELERRIGARGFVRAHRRALVRVGAVTEVATTAGGGVVARLESGATIPVSRRLRPAFSAAVRTGTRVDLT
ncbi:MAG TPA: LytTR family DNA-binding domain-containing protein [Vicinamibacterales bacterium]|nr:LytTR family DNA-binding domain-containing protein [Vicinamibacterales bacterium]